MNLSVDIPDRLAAALKAKADELGMSESGYARQVLERELRPDDADVNSVDAPVWEAVTDIMRDVPDEVFDRLPKDAASEVDHYIYGLPKRNL